MRHRATVEFDSSVSDPGKLVQVIRDSGYDAALPRVSIAEQAATHSDNINAGVWKAALTIGGGVIAMLIPMHWLMGPESSPGLRWGLLAVTAALSVWAASAIYLSAWKAMLHRETNMNTLVSLGTLVAFFYSAYGTIWPSNGANLYFDSVLLILGFLLLGKWLEERARRSALASVDALAQLQPATARVRRQQGDLQVEEVVPLAEVHAGDMVVILAGERVPADGVISTGRTTVDESMLTGESVPLERGVGERVLAGSLNYDGVVVVRVESAGEATVLAQIGRLVEQAQGSRAPMQRLADRASAVFVPVVLGLAVVTFVGWMLATHNVGEAITATVAVLVIACPCAMGLAVPAALTVAMGRGAQFGVLIKGGEALERLGGLQAVMMDKTGTLTMGKPTLVGMRSLGDFSEENLLRMAASIEDHSSHPLAAAVVGCARQRGLDWCTAQDVQSIPGRGISAVVEGKNCLLGNMALLEEWSAALPKMDGLPQSGVGVTRLWLAISDGASRYTAAGYFDAKDTVRPGARAVVEWLCAAGLETEMLTGDSAEAAAPIAQAVGISKVEAGLLPADKLNHIRSMQQDGKLRVAMVGDGVNDAAALAQADAGFAMGAGAALAQEAGDVLLLRSDPAGICTAIALSRAALRVMKENLGWAVGYNIIGIPLAAGLLYPAFHVMLMPWMAAAAMAFSSVSVLLNSLRLRGWKAPVIR
jgi:Cu+-exporting ATPase